MRNAAFIMLCLAALAGSPAHAEMVMLHGFSHQSEAEYQAELLGPDYQSGLIYDCLFTPTNIPTDTPVRQYIHDESGLDDILYCEPIRSDAMSCFDHTVQAGVEVFDAPPTKTIRVAADGSAQMRVQEMAFDAEWNMMRHPAIDYTGTCQRGAAYPDGVTVPQP